MKFTIIAVFLASFVAKSVSQAIFASLQLISGSGGLKPASYPLEYGVYNSTNTPGSRSCHRIIVYHNLIYSFHGYSSPGNDVWAFNITSKTWSWIAGNSTSLTPSFGSLGVFSVSNTPGNRARFGGDFHRARGEYILFGGYMSGNVNRGDLWTYNFVSNTWTWLAGRSSANQVDTMVSF
eukprot:Partr_v1_DN27573_c2_g1_i3_m30148 putative to trefoil factor